MFLIIFNYILNNLNHNIYKRKTQKPTPLSAGIILQNVKLIGFIMIYNKYM